MDDSSQLLARFKRLMQDVETGVSERNTFRSWEIELLVDMQSCVLDTPNRRRVLRRYEKAVQRGIERGATCPLKLSEYLARVRSRHYRRHEPPLEMQRRTA